MSENQIQIDLQRNARERLMRWMADTSMRYEAAGLSSGDVVVDMASEMTHFLARVIAHFFSIPSDMAGEELAKYIDVYREPGGCSVRGVGIELDADTPQS